MHDVYTFPDAYMYTLIKESIDIDGIKRYFLVSPSAPALFDHQRERYRSFP